MQSWGFLVLRTGVEWWVAVLNSMPPTGTNLHAKSSGAAQKTQFKKGGTLWKQKGKRVHSERLRRKVRKRNGYIRQRFGAMKEAESNNHSEGGLSAQGSATLPLCDPGEDFAACDDQLC